MKLCIGCKSNKVDKGKRFCSSCRKKPWQKHKKSICECCGFIPIHLSQLDVDHIDGNKQNNSVENLKTLCANCHRLKTVLNNDYLSKDKDVEVTINIFQLNLI